MILPDWKIRKYIKEGKIRVEPFDESLIGPASLDVRLGFRFRIFKPEFLEAIDIRSFRDEVVSWDEFEEYSVERYKHSEVVVIKKRDTPFIIHPGEFVLASIYEYVALPDNVAAQLNGRSSIARLGLIVHTSAGWVDPGYEGHLTLEILNVNSVPVKLYPTTPVAQLTFFEMESVETPYNKRKKSKYVGEKGATESRISSDFQ
ncbi:MAG: dCTP deaminase [Candidatus Diapherotrites archaeon]|nr:dCTP deaminase [Candidatus Diapherotrites archaeon]